MMTSGWTLKRISGPELEPITLDQAKQQCRVDDDITVDDSALLDWITAARELAEEYTKRTFVPSTWLLTGSLFPTRGAISLPMGPLIEVESVSYKDVDGARQTIDPADYQIIDGMPPELWPGNIWPRTLSTAGAVQIQYRAGYKGQGSPEDASGVPAAVRSAIRLLVGHWYSARETVVAETRITPAVVPFTFERALDHLKVYP